MLCKKSGAKIRYFLEVCKVYIKKSINESVFLHIHNKRFNFALYFFESKNTNC